MRELFELNEQKRAIEISKKGKSPLVIQTESGTRNIYLYDIIEKTISKLTIKYPVPAFAATAHAGHEFFIAGG